MQIYISGKQLNQQLKGSYTGKQIGFVPTMGALHKGHLSLIERSKVENEVTVVSIFVNPLQFNNQNDLKLYPTPIEKDTQLLEQAGCDILFQPAMREMYEEEPLLSISFGYLEEIMEGKHRPGHFNGVGIIVTKLFNKINPVNAYFGQKDLQQLTVVKQLVKDLSFNINVLCCPTFREEDGLAMSSRNLRIPEKDRQVAGKIFEALQLAKKIVLIHNIAYVKEIVVKFLSLNPPLKLEYFEIVDASTLKSIRLVTEAKEVALCIAVYLNDIRLIDNLILSTSST